MAKAKSIRDNNNGTLQGANGDKPDSSKRIELTNTNASIFAVKVLAELRDEIRMIRVLLEKQSG